MDNIELSQAHLFLREKQEKAFANASEFGYKDENITERSLQFLKEYTKFVLTDDPERVMRGHFSYEREKEERRIKRAEEIIRRIMPGPFEDPIYFAMIAYQAASIEITKLWPEQKKFDHVLLGTIHKPEVNAFVQPSSDYSVVLLHSALLDFIYQAAKSVIEATNPVYSKNKLSAIRTEGDIEKIKEMLLINQNPIIRLYKTIESYYFYGYPRTFSNEIVKTEQSMPLSILDSMAERWVIAHEYGHAFLFGKNLFPDTLVGERNEEYMADASATIFTVYSAAEYDGLPPEFSLSGCNFALACQEILDKTLCILNTGSESSTKQSPHPPNKLRAERNINTFRQFFNIRYEKVKGFKLQFIARNNLPENHPFGAEQSKRVYLNSNVLFSIWDYVKELLIQQYKSKRPLHQMWS
jgi:hypothetical protein